MKAEIISIGTELLLGHIVNEDAAIVARKLAELGIEVVNMQVVGDNPERLAAALALAGSRSSLIITTGGLGPTGDDLSKEVVAGFSGHPLVKFTEAEQALKAYFGELLPGSSQPRQSMFPEGSTILPNRVGTAPGCIVPFGEKQHIVMLPGPPGELNPMLEIATESFLSELSSGVISSRILRTFGIGEGTAAEKISDLMQGSNPTVAPYATQGEMFVKITARASDKDAALKMCLPIEEQVRERLGDVIYGVDVSSLEEVVLQGLLEQKKTIATAESCTGGLLAKRITDLPGASAIFSLGVVTYSNAAKEALLSIRRAMLSEYGAVSSQVASAMATAVRSLASSYYGVGITGIAGPDGGTLAKPVGTVYIALAAPTGCWLRKMEPLSVYPGRQFVRQRAASHALDMVRRNLARQPIKDGMSSLFRQ